MSGQKRVLILANRSKEPVREAVRRLRPWLEQRAEVVGEVNTAEVTHETAGQLPGADLGLILGGDGTMLHQARMLIERDLPLLGINFGKLGFLAEFSIESFMRHWDCIVEGKCPSSDRLMLAAEVLEDGDQSLFSAVAMNDVVINAGQPFRLIELGLSIRPPHDAEPTVLHSDGVVVSTPSGSTAYNLSAGGPIISPGIEGFCITAICPYTLAARPIVAPADCQVLLQLNRANAGTQLVIDGQETYNLMAGQRVLVRRHDRRVRLIHNPDYNYWQMLAHKMRWAAPPQRG
ncbi:MAG: NAD(+)/NADH kinase [Phycisphaeraceae bacterium]|nr:NAD(+)/NADH kinase [Phycisphaeraceae bacterium]